MHKSDGRSKRLVDLTGKRYGKLIVAERAENDKYGKPTWLCHCDCGNAKVVSGAALKRGDTISCGCMQGIRKDLECKPQIMRRSHNNRLYNTWGGMIYRCYNEKTSSYPHYGGRGITVCDEWRNSFEAFTEWAIENGYTDSSEIDRINNDGPYSPQNCRWVPHKANSRNRGARNESGVSGVNFRKNRDGNGGKWRVGIMVDGKQVNIGTFEDIQTAIKARQNAELKYWGVTRINP